MKTIHKYPIEIATGRARIETPENWKPLFIDVDPSGETCIWARVETKNMMVRRDIRIFGTGHEIPAMIGDYIGSFIDGLFVWHVFERGLSE